MKTKNILLLLILFLILYSCIPPSRVQEIKDNATKNEKEKEKYKGEKIKFEIENVELRSKLKSKKERFDKIIKDSIRVYKEVKKLKTNLKNCKQKNKDIIEANITAKESNQKENNRLLEELQIRMEEIQKKEDKLEALSIELERKKQNLEILKKELEKREVKVKELKDIIAKKDRMAKVLKNKIKEALSGFANKGIKVEQRNGRVYVSMEAKLLFASGSTSVGWEGKKAIIKLSKALETIEDITILVEGHTDNDPIKSAQIKNNWDLSVMRSISIVHIMIDNSKINPSKLTAAGRGEFSPLMPNNSATNKSKNRRIEIILTPNLNKLFDLLEN